MRELGVLSPGEYTSHPNTVRQTRPKLCFGAFFVFLRSITRAPMCFCLQKHITVRATAEQNYRTNYARTGGSESRGIYLAPKCSSGDPPEAKLRCFFRASPFDNSSPIDYLKIKKDRRALRSAWGEGAKSSRLREDLLLPECRRGAAIPKHRGEFHRLRTAT